MYGDVRILPEGTPSDLPRGVCAHRCPKDRSGIVCLSALQPWIWRQYDPVYLMQRIQSLWLSPVAGRDADVTPDWSMLRDPMRFSYWAAHNIPLDDAGRQQLLECRSTTDRLKEVLRFLENYAPISCKRCRTVISDRKEVFSMSEEGSVGTFVNPHGYIHQMVTLRKAKNMRLVGRASTQDSWFPGYAWTIANCVCGCHLGWRFTAVSEGLAPKTFWGLRRNGLENSKGGEGDRNVSVSVSVRDVQRMLLV